MVIHTIFTCVARSLRRIVASIVALFIPMKAKPSSGDIETGMLASDVEEIESPIFSEVIDIRRQSDQTSAGESQSSDSETSFHGLRRSRRISVHPVKSRILDATLKNVRDRRLSVLKSVVITPCSMTPLPCSVKVEFLPDSLGLGRSPLNSALQALKSSKKRVVQFVLTPTFLPEADSRTSHLGSSSIEDLFDLFPSPPLHLPAKLAISPRNSIAVVNPNADEFFACTGSTVSESVKYPEDRLLTHPESLLSSTVTSGPSYPVDASPVLPTTAGLLVRASPRIVYSEGDPSLCYSALGDIPEFMASSEFTTSEPSVKFLSSLQDLSSAACYAEVLNNTASSVPTRDINGAALSCATASSCIPSSPVLIHSLSANGTDPKETEIDAVTLSDGDAPSPGSEVQPKVLNSRSYGDVAHHPSRRQSITKILKVFQDTKTEDRDFRDLLSSALCGSISTMQRVDNAMDSFGTSCSSSTSHTDISCSRLLLEGSNRDDGDVATPNSVSDDDMVLSSPVFGSILEPFVEFAHSPAVSLGAVHESLHAGLGITRLGLIKVDSSKDAPSSRDLLRMLDRWVAIDGDTKAVNPSTSESDLVASCPFPDWS